MKPRTKIQHEIVHLSKYLSNIDNKMLAWAKIECLAHKAFMTKTKTIYLDCGQSFSTELVKRKRTTCPHCHTELKVELTRKRTDSQKIYVAFAEVLYDFQIIRNFEIKAEYKFGESAYYSISEILQNWILPNGKHEAFGRNHTVTHYYESWNGDMEIRKNYVRYYSPANKYDVYPCKYHPESKFKAQYTLHGINNDLSSISPNQYIEPQRSSSTPF